MPTDATGTPTSLGIPTFNTSQDAPSGLGSNEQMAIIDTLLADRVTNEAAYQVFNVKNPAYAGGAKGDGVTDDTAAINAAITAAAVAGGTVFLPAGTFVISSAVTVPGGVNLQGAGGSKVSPATVLKMTAAGARIAFGALGTVSSGGMSGHFKVDGNSTATNPFFVGLTVDRKFMAITVANAAAGSAGALIQQAQNNLFLNFVVEDNAADGLTLDRGTGGNVFVRTELNNNGRYNLLFTQSALSSIDVALGLFGSPTLNSFYGGDFEGQAAAQAANVLHEAGTFNMLHGVALSSAPTAAHSIIKMTLGGVGTPGSGFFRIIDSYILGNATFSTGIDVGSNTSIYLRDPYLSTLLNGIAQDVSSAVYGQVNDTLFSGVTNQFTGIFSSNKIQGKTAGSWRASNGLGTFHWGTFTPSGGVSGDIHIGNGKVWINDSNNWRFAQTQSINALAYSASITPDFTFGPLHTVSVTNSTAFTINAPTNPPSSTQTGELVIEVVNISGGAMGVITWNAAFVFAGATWTNPANGQKRQVRFRWNGTKWISTGVTAADYA